MRDNLKFKPKTVFFYLFLPFSNIHFHIQLTQSPEESLAKVLNYEFRCDWFALKKKIEKSPFNSTAVFGLEQDIGEDLSDGFHNSLYGFVSQKTWQMPVLVQQAWVSPLKCSEDTGFVCLQQKRIAIIHDISAHHRLLQDDSENFDVQRTRSRVEAT